MGALSSSAGKEEDTGARAIAAPFLHHPEAWIEAAASGMGWQLLDDIYSKVEKLRRVVTRRSDRNSSIFSRGGRHDDYFGFDAAGDCEEEGDGDGYGDGEAEGGDAEAQANLAIASCLLRRVSVPLLDSLQRVMFHLDRDGCDTEDVGALLAVSPRSLWDPAHCASAGEQSSDVAALYASQLWASGRIALLYPEVYAAAQQLALPAPLSAGDLAHSRSLLSSAWQDLLDRCKHLESPLVLPLHPRDVAALVQSAKRAEQRLGEMRGEVARRLRTWVGDSEGETETALKGKDEEKEEKEKQQDRAADQAAPRSRESHR
jgi:hypothetical protein